MPAKASERVFEYERPYLYPQQMQAMFNDAKYSVTAASTKSGKTHAAMAWLFEMAFTEGKPGWQYWWVAPVRNTAKIAYERFKKSLHPSLYRKNDTDLTLTLVNGPIIWCRGSDDPDSLYGEDVHAAVMDEYTRCREASWVALRSTLTATDGPVRLIGNVKGKKNWGWVLAQRWKGRMERGDPEYHYSVMTAWDAVMAGVISEKNVLEAQSDMSEQDFKRLYLAQPGDDDGNPFGLDAIADCVHPISGREPYVWGWDLARGKNKDADWTVGIALDQYGIVCREPVRFQAPWKVTYSRIKNTTGRTPAMVDASTYGDSFTEFLMSESPGVFEPYNMQGGPRKQNLIEGLITAVKSNQVHFPPDGVIRDELEAYEYVVNQNDYTIYNAPDGQHDDAVIALALAVAKMRGHVGGYLDEETTEADVKAAEKEEAEEAEWTEENEEEYHRRFGAAQQLLGGNLWARGRRAA